MSHFFSLSLLSVICFSVASILNIFFGLTYHESYKVIVGVFCLIPVVLLTISMKVRYSELQKVGSV